MVLLLAKVGHVFNQLVESVGRVVGVSCSSVWACLRSRYGLSQCIAQSALLSYRCFVPVILVAGPIGAMLALQSLSITRQFGVDRLLPPLISATVIRELAPGFAAVMVCFQAGAGIAAELGTMRVQEELAAIEVMGLDARAFVIGPRIVGAINATFLLNAIAILAAMIGAYVVAVPLAGMGHATFVQAALEGITPYDIQLSQSKALLFGALLGGTSATFGAFASGGPRGVGLAANRAVVATVILILACNYVMNTILYGLRGVL